MTRSTGALPRPAYARRWWDLRLWGEEGEQPWDGKSIGEIQVRGPSITDWYYEVPVTGDKFTEEGWLRTCVVASVAPLGFVRITGRAKDLIELGGERISSADLEIVLMEHPAVAEAAVIAIPHEKWNERRLACAVLRPGKAVDTKGFDQYLLTRNFAKWQLPDRYEFIDAVPRTYTHKFWIVKLGNASRGSAYAERSRAKKMSGADSCG